MKYTKTIIESYDTLRLFKLYEKTVEKVHRAEFDSSCKIPYKTREKNQSDLDLILEVLTVRFQTERLKAQQENRENWVTPYRDKKDKERQKRKEKMFE